MPDEVINLPEATLKVHHLKIRKPITIVGNTNSVLEITHTITIDLSEYPGCNPVTFSECAIIFEYCKQRSTLNSATISTLRIEPLYKFND